MMWAEFVGRGEVRSENRHRESFTTGANLSRETRARATTKSQRANEPHATIASEAKSVHKSLQVPAPFHNGRSRRIHRTAARLRAGALCWEFVSPS
jgi:hypothetical protein